MVLMIGLLFEHAFFIKNVRYLTILEMPLRNPRAVDAVRDRGKNTARHLDRRVHRGRVVRARLAHRSSRSG